MSVFSWAKCDPKACRGPVRQLFEFDDCSGASYFEELNHPKTCHRSSNERYERLTCIGRNSSALEFSTYASTKGCSASSWISSTGWHTGICINVWNEGVGFRSMVYWCDSRDVKRREVRIVERWHDPAVPLLESVRCPAPGCITDVMSFHYRDNECAGGLNELQPAWERQIWRDTCHETTSPQVRLKLSIDDDDIATITYYAKRCEWNNAIEFKKVKLENCLTVPFGSFYYRAINESRMNDDRSALIEPSTPMSPIDEDFTAGLALFIFFVFLFLSALGVLLYERVSYYMSGKTRRSYLKRPTLKARPRNQAQVAVHKLL